MKTKRNEDDSYLAQALRFANWALSVLFIILGLASFTDSIFGGLLIILGATLILPPVGKVVTEKFHLKLPAGVRWVIFVALVVIGIILMPTTEQPDSSGYTSVKVTDEVKEPEVKKEIAVIEMTAAQLFSEFSRLSDLQIEEKIKELKGKRIKTSIYVDNVDKASLSTQYVVMDMYEYPFNLMPYVKAFFPNEEKDELLKANVGDTLVFSGEFVTYNKGSLTDGYIEFTKSAVLEIKSGSGTKSTSAGKMGGISKIEECAKLCAGEEYGTPVYRDAWHDTCSQLYYYAGEEALDQQIAQCKG